MCVYVCVCLCVSARVKGVCVCMCTCTRLRLTLYKWGVKDEDTQRGRISHLGLRLLIGLASTLQGFPLSLPLDLEIGILVFTLVVASAFPDEPSPQVPGVKI